jgi:hypothetical protein
VERHKDYVLRTVEERGVRFVQMWFTDVLGTPKSFQITPAELENALSEGMTFDGSTIDGFTSDPGKIGLVGAVTVSQGGLDSKQMLTLISHDSQVRAFYPSAEFVTLLPGDNGYRPRIWRYHA